MIRDQKKTKQIAAGFLIILSLFVSSVAACICSHHAEKAEPEALLCHGHSEKKPEPSNGDASEKNPQFNTDDECCCLQPAPRAISKSEAIKLEKQAPALPSPKVVIKKVSLVIKAESVYFERPFYLTDSFYKLKSPRAPPTV